MPDSFYPLESDSSVPHSRNRWNHWRVSARKQASACLLVLGLICIGLPDNAEARPGQNHSLWQYSGSPMSRVYADVQWGVQAIGHSDLNFYPAYTSGGIGLWLFDNIGIETFGDLGLEAYQSGPFTVEIEEAGGVGLRFQSPPKRGLSAYLVAGYVDFQLTQVESDSRGTRRVSQGFGGVRFSVGLAQRLRSFDSVLLTAEYRNYYSQSEIQVDLLSVGFRVNVR